MSNMGLFVSMLFSNFNTVFVFSQGSILFKQAIEESFGVGFGSDERTCEASDEGVQ